MESGAFGLTIDAAELREALAQSVTGNSKNIPIWGHALLACGDREVCVTTTDSERTLALTLPARTSTGRATVEVAQLRGALTALEGEVRLVATGGRVVLSQGRRRFRILTLPPADFPAAGEEGLEALGGDAIRIGEALEAVAYAMGKNDVRYWLNGAAIDNDYVIASDGIRLAAAPLARHAGQQLIIPRASVALIAAHCAKNGALEFSRVGEGAPPNAISVTTSRARVRARVIDGKYPDVRATFTDAGQAPHRADFAPEQLLAALTRMAPFLSMRRDDAGRGALTVRLRVEGGRLIVTPEDEAEGSDEVECAGATAEAFEAKFNPAYLTDVLREAKGKAVTWAQAGPFDRQHFRVEGSDVAHLMMPLK